MERHRNALLLSLILLLAAGFACSNPADDKPEAVVDKPLATAAPVNGTPYAFTADSRVDWVGSKITGSHDGGFHSFEGEISLVDGDPARSSVSVIIDTTSLWADNEKLTGHLKSPDFFDVEAHPTARFDSTSIEATEEGYQVTGNLELHGVTKSVRFPATITVEEGRVTAEAEFFIQRFDFDIVYPGKPDDLIRDEVVIRLSLVAEPARETAGGTDS